MPSYNYKARDNFGKLFSGGMDAESDNEVAAKLRHGGYVVISIKEAQVKLSKFKLPVFNRVKFSDLNMFTRQFLTLQRAGIPILSSLSGLKEQATNKTLQAIIGSLYSDIEGGLSLSAAMGRYPRVFSPLYVNVVKAGEASGTLDDSLERLALLGENEEKISMRIKSATRYPIIVVITLGVAFFILTTFIVSRFASLYAQFRVSLPLPTRVLIGLNYMITKFWWAVLISSGFSYLLFRRFVKTSRGRLWWDTLKLKVPVFGPLVLKLTMSRFARITGTLMHSGVPILHILDLAMSGVGNVVIAHTIEGIKKSVIEGKGMAIPMKSSGLFPPVVTQMVAAGEETGKVDELLLHVSEYYDSQVDYTIGNFVTLIEPILIFVLGGCVLFIALSIFLPVWNLMSLFRG
ncbi:MAG: type II secretion system F family protein [Candidatus Omnitrophota bacterium]